MIEKAGIATVVVAARPFKARLEAMAVPRLLLTPFPMGRVFGRPGDRKGQRAVVELALNMLETAVEGKAVQVLSD